MIFRPKILEKYQSIHIDNLKQRTRAHIFLLWALDIESFYQKKTPNPKQLKVKSTNKLHLHILFSPAFIAEERLI